jgi:hypothetical protein
MKRAKLQHAIKSKQHGTKLYNSSKNMIITKKKSQTQNNSNQLYALQKK